MSPALRVLVIFLCLVVTCVTVIVLLLRNDTYLIESNEPLQDIVIICDWSSELSTLHGGSHSVTHKKALVVESGQPYTCGINWSAGLSLSFRSSNMAKHPTHTFAYVEERGGVIVLQAISKLQPFDEQKAKFEAGYWDKHRNPGRSYLSSLPGCSGLPHQYLEYYSEVRKIDVEEFKRKYNDKIFECVRKVYEEILKHDPYSSKQLPTPEKSMEMLWDPLLWRKYE